MGTLLLSINSLTAMSENPQREQKRNSSETCC